MRIPARVADSEWVARYSKKKFVRPDLVKWQAFGFSKIPAKISVDRDAYCDVTKNCATRNSGVSRSSKSLEIPVLILTKSVRAIPSADVSTEQLKGNPAHANIVNNALIGFGTKAAVKKADAWEDHTDFCRKLADIVSTHSR